MPDLNTKEQLIRIGKGLMEPQDFRFNNQMTPEKTNSFISMVVADNNFLSQVHTERMRELSKPLDVWDIEPEQLVRNHRRKPTADELVGMVNKGRLLTALKVKLNAKITLEAMRDNQDNPQIMRFFENSLTTVFRNDLTNLAFNGVGDDGSDFKNLNEGWIKLATDRPKCKKITINPTTDGWAKSLLKIVEAADSRYESASDIIMNRKDYLKYSYEMGARVIGSPTIADRKDYDFLGIDIKPVNHIPAGSVLFTPVKNLVFGVNTLIRRDKEYDIDEEALIIVFNWAIDYLFRIDEAVVLATTA